jgi:hypothetical protein
VVFEFRSGFRLIYVYKDGIRLTDYEAVPHGLWACCSVKPCKTEKRSEAGPSVINGGRVLPLLYILESGRHCSRKC